MNTDLNGKFLLLTPGMHGNLGYQSIYDPLLIQFIHRSLAYILCILVIIWFYTPSNCQARLPSGG